MNGFLQLLLILAVSEVSKSTLRFNDSLETLTELKKEVEVTVRVYCINGTQKGKWCTRQNPGEIRHEFSLSSPSAVTWTCSLLPCDNMNELLPSQEAHLSLDVWGFYRRSVV